MPEQSGCSKCKELEQAYIRPREERTRILLRGNLRGNLTEVDRKRLAELKALEALARERLKDHHAGHLK